MWLAEVEGRIRYRIPAELAPGAFEPQQLALWKNILLIAASEEAMLSHMAVLAEIKTGTAMPAVSWRLQQILIRYHSVTRAMDACTVHAVNARVHEQPEEFFRQWEDIYAVEQVGLTNQLAVAVSQMFLYSFGFTSGE